MASNGGRLILETRRLDLFLQLFINRWSYSFPELGSMGSLSFLSDRKSNGHAGAS